MMVKKLAYSAQRHLQACMGTPFSRSHVYELLAASFGFNSYAALGVSAVFTKTLPGKDQPPAHPLIKERWLSLGYPPDTADRASLTLAAFLAEHRLGLIRFTTLIQQLQGEAFYEREYIDDDENSLNAALTSEVDPGPMDYEEDVFPQILLEGLHAAADRDNALAHYALALIYDSGVEDDALEVGSSYWHSQAQQGRELTGVELEWAESYAAQQAEAQKYEHHLRAAALLGHPPALLDLAQRFHDPSFFERPLRPNCKVDPSTAAAIAEQLGRPEDARQWLTVAAESGDTEAMRQLIERYDYDDLLRCWTWLYLAELLGEDLTRDQHYAIHENGSAYDDDAGGPMFVGGRDGVDLPHLHAEQDAVARQQAQAIFARIEQARETKPLA